MCLTRFLPPLLAALLFSGCGIQPIKKPIKEHLSITQFIQQSALLYKQKQYSEAEEILAQARKYYPNDSKLKQQLEQTKIARQKHKQRLEDQLLAAKLTFIQQQRPLLSQLAKSEANDLAISSQLLQLEKTWQESRSLLSACKKRQQKAAPDIAERCLRLALAIKEDKSDRTQLTQIEYNKTKAAQKRQQQQKAAQIQQLLKQARLNQAHNKRYSALILLEQTLKLAPESASAISLRKEIQDELDTYTQGLLSAGEALYQRGQLKGAITVWNTLLLLNPQHKKAQQKIKRTQRVLNNLQHLRQQQDH